MRLETHTAQFTLRLKIRMHDAPIALTSKCPNPDLRHQLRASRYNFSITRMLLFPIYAGPRKPLVNSRETHYYSSGGETLDSTSIRSSSLARELEEEWTASQPPGYSSLSSPRSGRTDPKREVVEIYNI